MKYFEGKTVIRKTAIENAIICAIAAGEDSITDVSKLAILHLLCTLLFVNSGSTISWIWLKNIESMHKYNWSKGVKDYLEMCLNALQNRTREKAASLGGCVIAIQMKEDTEDEENNIERTYNDDEEEEEEEEADDGSTKMEEVDNDLEEVKSVNIPKEDETNKSFEEILQELGYI